MDVLNLDLSMMPIALVYFIPAVASLLTFVYILIRIPKTFTARVFTLFVGTSVVWQVSEGFIRLSSSYDMAMFWHKLLSISVIVAIASCFHFTALFVKNKRLVNSWGLPIGVYLPAVMFIIAHALDLVVWYVDPHPTLNWVSDSEFTLFEKFEAIWMMVLASGFLAQMINYAWKSRNEEEMIKKRALLMSVGFFFPVLFGVVFQILIPLISSKIPNLPLASPSMIFFILAALIALEKYRFLSYDPNIAIDKILETMDSGVVIFDHDLKIKYINKAFEKFSGYNKSEIVDLPVSKLNTDIDSDVDFDRNDINPNKQFEIKIKGKNEETRTMLVNYSRYLDHFDNHIGTLALFTDITEKVEMQEHLVQEKHQALQYQSMLIGSQLNPHFIFNALNSVQYYILEQDVPNALSCVSDFSTLMRSVLQNSMNKLINLSTEIEFLKKYIELELKRFHNKFEYSVEVIGEIDPEETFVPPMLIQPYIENAIVHGFSAITRGGKLSVVFELIENKYVKCTIKDNGIGITKKALDMSEMKRKLTKHPSQGMGLLKKRIEILNETDEPGYRVEVQDRNEVDGKKGTIVEVYFPLKDTV